MSQKHERAIVLFSGTVQGVGFRYTVQHIARTLAVCGYVRNLADGRVELVAEGLRRDIETFITKIEVDMARYITSANILWNSANGEFSAFGVRF